MNPVLSEIRNEIKKVIKGKDIVIDKILCAIIAEGHILLEDIPGVGKTTLAMALAKSMSLSYKRVQFTPDVLPSDIVGFSMYQNNTGTFEYRPGAVFSNLFLADEINRTSPKTQSALLEVMEEGQVTVDGVTRSLPAPFIVIATQNPLGSSGTQRLPESQLDRFMVRLSMGYPDHDNAIEILKGDTCSKIDAIHTVIPADVVKQMQNEAEQLYVHDNLYDYIVRLTEETRKAEYFELGLSPRGSIALLRMAKATAYLNQRNYMVAEDIRSVFNDVCCHRVVLSTRAKTKSLNELEVLSNLFTNVPIPGTP